MAKIVKISSFSIELEDQKILRLLGYPPSVGADLRALAFGWSGPRANMDVRPYKERALALMEPKGIYAIRKVISKGEGEVGLEGGITFEGWNIARALRAAEEAAIFVVTLGDEISKEIRSLFEERRFAEAVTLDAVASVATDALADQIHKRVIGRDARTKGLFPGLRYSPGYCFWPLEEQGKIFSILRPEDIGVCLNSHFFMIPEK